MDWGDWFMWVGFTLLLALGLAYMLTGWYDDFSSQCRTETIENLIIILGIVVPIYNAVQSGSHAKKISASTNLCLATVTFMLVGFESYKSTRARRKLIEGAYGSLSMYQSEFSSIKEDGILLIGKRNVGWRIIPGKVIARLIFCLFSFLFSASEVWFRFDAADHPHNWFNKQLSKCFAKYSFSLSPIFLGALFLFNRFADFQEKPNRPKVRCFCEYISDRVEPNMFNFLTSVYGDVVPDDSRAPTHIAVAITTDAPTQTVASAPSASDAPTQTVPTVSTPGPTQTVASAPSAAADAPTQTVPTVSTPGSGVPTPTVSAPSAALTLTVPTVSTPDSGVPTQSASAPSSSAQAQTAPFYLPLVRHATTDQTALVSTCRSVTFDANTTDGRTLAINFMVRTPGDRDYDWSIDFADVIVLSFDLSDKKAKTTLEAKVTKLKEVLPKKPIVLIGRYKKVDAPEGPGMQHDRDVLDSIAQISVDFAMVLNFESGANARTLVDVLAVLCDTS